MRIHVGPESKLLAAALPAAAAVLLAAPATANVNIPEGGIVQSDSVSVITFRVLDGCEGEPTESLEVTIPDGVRNVQPESVPGWSLIVETDPAVEPEELPDVPEDVRITKVTWTGGSLPADTFGDFGMRAQFPDADELLAFPVLQRCGSAEIAWDGERGSDRPAPTVALGSDINDREQVELAQTVETLRADVAALEEELSGVDPRNVRDRVGDVEERLPELADRMDRLGQRISELADRVDGIEQGGE